MPSLAKRYRHKRPGKIKIFGADDRNAKWACLESTLLLPTASVAGTAQVLIDRLPESIRKCTTHSPGRHPIPHMADASSQGMLSAFPFLTEPEFDHACAAFLDRVQALESLYVSGWSSVRLEKQTCGTVLKISRVIDSPTTLNREKATLEDTPESHESQADAFEDDPEALARTADPDPYFQVEYDILLSPTYRVPVLYFVLRGSRVGPVGIETVYQYLVPDQYKKEVKSVGVLGGISMGVCAPGSQETDLPKLTFHSIIQNLALQHSSLIHAIPRTP